MAPIVAGMSTGLLAPIVALNLWTFTMEAWMYATRIPAASKYKVDVRPEATIQDFNAKIPPSVRWKADNYNHLHEQPTQFYAIALTLASLAGPNPTRLDTRLAWSYVGIRIIHSLIQAISNKIMLRFQAFIVSSFILLAMTGRAAAIVFA